MAWCVWAAAVAAATLPFTAAQVPAEVDYVIVGGGTAGCVLAARLCEGMPGAQIALLERGDPRSEEAEHLVRAMRQYFSPVTGNAEASESFESAPNSGLSDSRTVGILAGKSLGGSSAINGAQFSTPEFSVPASWGVAGLTAGTAQRLYNKVRAQLGVAQPPPKLTQDYFPEYFQANAAAGVDVVAPPDIPVGADNDAVWVSYLAADPQGRRVDSARGYLDPMKDAACANNLQIIQGATVGKVLLDGDTATGVEYTKDGDTQVINAREEVVMSAGPFHSAKLLQLSGIGPAEVLAEFDIPSVADLPVGESAQARAYDQILSSYRGMPLSAGGDDVEAASPEARAQFDAGNGGILGFARSQINGVLGAPIGAWRVVSWINEIGPGTDPRIHQAGCIPNPTSRAQVTLRSNDPSDTPLVNTNIFGSEGEAEQMAACLNREREIINNMPPTFEIAPFAPEGGTITASDVRSSAGNGNHFVGACAIGTVLDENLKVLGFENLRVVDASAIPDIPPNTGPAASVYMLAEHIAEQIIASGPHADTPPTSPPPTSTPDVNPPPTASPSPDACGGEGEVVCSGTQLSARDPPYECDFGFMGEGGVCVPFTSRRMTAVQDKEATPLLLRGK